MVMRTNINFQFRVDKAHKQTLRPQPLRMVGSLHFLVFERLHCRGNRIDLSPVRERTCFKSRPFPKTKQIEKPHCSRVELRIEEARGPPARRRPSLHCVRLFQFPFPVIRNMSSPDRHLWPRWNGGEDGRTDWDEPEREQ